MPLPGLWKEVQCLHIYIYIKFLPQVTHFAGSVVYNVTDFMDKNKVYVYIAVVYALNQLAILYLLHTYTVLQDTQFQDLKRMLYNCELPALKEMFPEVSNTELEIVANLTLDIYFNVNIVTIRLPLTITSKINEPCMQGANPITKVTKRPITVGAQFKNDVCELIDLLEHQV